MVEETRRNGFRKKFLQSGKVNEGLKEVLKYELRNENMADPSFNERDFFTYFYFDNKSFQNARKNLYKEIESNNSKYFVIHGYAKTGKSTFFRHLQYSSKDELKSIQLKTIGFDIAADFSSEPGKMNTLKTVALKQLLKPFLDNSYKSSRAVQKIKNFNFLVSEAEEVLQMIDEEYQKEYENIEDAPPSPLVNLLGYLSHQVSGKIAHLIKEINKTENDTYLNHEGRKNSIHTQIIDLGQSLYDYLDTNYKDGDSGKILCYLLFLKIIQNKEYFADTTGKQKVLLFIFDNIDDVLYDLAIAVSTNYAHSICVFLDTLDGLFRFYDKILVNFRPSINIKVAFVYRTANYANIYHSGLSISSEERSPSWALLREAYNCKITTVKDASEILDRRYNFYLSLLTDDEERQLNRYFPALIKALKFAESSENDNPDNETNFNDFRFMFRLSNGSRIPILTPTFYNICDELDWSIYTDDSSYSFLKRGAFLFIFIKSLLSLQNDNAQRSLNDVFFSFLSNNPKRVNDSRCDLLRLIFAYIINSLTPESKKREIYDMKDMQKLGVSLYDLLESIYKIKKTTGLPAYEKNEVIDLFELLFDGEIDSFDYLLSHNKSAKRDQIISSGEPPVLVQGKYVSFSKEIDAFWKFKTETDPGEAAIRLVQSTKSIKFFYNDNTYYLYNHVWTHFECLSLAVNNSRPLMFSTKKNAHDLFIKNVYNEAERICKASLEHFIMDFTDWTPIDYCMESKFAHSERFYFASLIPRHVTYIEYFRYYHLNKINSFTDLNPKIAFNKILITHLENYINLFFELFNVLNEKFGENNLPPKVLAVRNSFLVLNQKISIVVEAGFTDFETRIQK